jgi:hypothetical protein
MSSGHIISLLTLALIGSSIIIIWIALKSKKVSDNQLVHAHWQLAWRRYRLLLIGYFASGMIMLFGWIMGIMQTDHQMQGILLVVFSRIAVVPTIIIVLILFVLSTSALSQARQGKMPSY